VESDDTFAWTAQQTIDLAERLAEVTSDVEVHEGRLAELIATETDRVTAEMAQRPAHMSCSPAAMHASIHDNVGVAEARGAVKSARIEAEATRLAHEWFAGLLEAEVGGAPLDDADLNVFELYGDAHTMSPVRTMSSTFDAVNSGGGSPQAPLAASAAGFRPPKNTSPLPQSPQPPTPHVKGFSDGHGQWVYQAGDGRQVYLHPHVARMIVETIAPATCLAPAMVDTNNEFPAGSMFDDGSNFHGHTQHHQQHRPQQHQSQPQRASSGLFIDPLAPLDLPTVSVKVNELEDLEQSKQLRSMYRPLSFIPLTGAFQLVFPMHPPSVISPMVLAKYRQTFEARRRKKAQKDRIEREEDEKLKAKDEETRKQRVASSSQKVPVVGGYSYGAGDIGGSSIGSSGPFGESPCVRPATPPVGVAAPPSDLRVDPSDVLFQPGGGSPQHYGAVPVNQQHRAGSSWSPMTTPQVSAWGPKSRNLLDEMDAPSLIMTGTASHPVTPQAAPARPGSDHPRNGNGASNGWTGLDAKQVTPTTPAAKKGLPWGRPG
jgi:hypothetical protein